MKLRNYTPLALLAADPEDLKVVSAVLQDAVMKVGDMAWLPEQRRFAFVANRFIWEDAAARRWGPYARVRAGAHFDDVTSVRTKSVRLDAKDAVIDVLSMEFSPEEDGGGVITLNLAGGGAIALTVASVNAEIRDVSPPWRTPKKPNHGER